MKKQPTAKQLAARAKFTEQARAKSGYTMEIKVNDRVFTCKTKDLLKALEQFGQEIIKTRTVIQVKKGDKTFSRILSVPIARRIFKNNMARRIFTNNISKFFKF